MDEERVRELLCHVGDGAPQPGGLRDSVQRRVVGRRRRVVGLSVAAVMVVGFSSAVTIDAVDDGARIEVVPATSGASTVTSGGRSTVTLPPGSTKTDVSVAFVKFFAPVCSPARCLSIAKRAG